MDFLILNFFDIFSRMPFLLILIYVPASTKNSQMLVRKVEKGKANAYHITLYPQISDNLIRVMLVEWYFPQHPSQQQQYQHHCTIYSVEHSTVLQKLDSNMITDLMTHGVVNDQIRCKFLESTFFQVYFASKTF